MAYTFHTDPGHGWLEVPASECAGLTFSRYSYRSHDGSKFYLEEDCDAAVFVDAYRAKHGDAPEFIELPRDSNFIRSLPPIQSRDEARYRDNMKDYIAKLQETIR